MENPTTATVACNLPHALDEGALIAAIDDAADDEISAHLRACAACATRAQAYAAMHTQLRRRLFRLFCPPPEELALVQQHAPDSARAADVVQHLNACPHCARELQLLGAVLGESPPGDVIADGHQQRAGPADDERC